MYGAEAIRRRRCRGVRKDGEACRAWALWGDPRQVCAAHAGHRRRNSGPRPANFWGTTPRTRPPNCRCAAYAWPHRPGGGLCRWPAPPLFRLAQPPSTHRLPRFRRTGRFGLRGSPPPGGPVRRSFPVVPTLTRKALKCGRGLVAAAEAEAKGQRVSPIPRSGPEVRTFVCAYITSG